MAKSKKDEIKESVGIKREEKEIEDLAYVSSGSTLLNCALSDKADGGFGLGKIANIIGESSAGKTMNAETILAMAAHDRRFDDYDLVLDDAEAAMEMNIAGMFGKKAASRIKAPNYNKDGMPISSETVEDFYANVWRKIKKEKPFIYCLDSLDSLANADDYDRANEHVKVADGDKKEVGGTYAMGKAKLLSEMLRTVKAELKKSNSFLLILSQTRDKIGFTGPGPKKTRAGGKALEFYCTHVVWLASTKSIKGGKSGKEVTIGKETDAKVSKNKLTGKLRTASFNIYYDYGIDDITSCFDFIVEHGDGTIKNSAKGFYTWEEQGFITNTRQDTIIRHIEDNKLQPRLVELVQAAWDSKEEALKLKRKPRFNDEEE